MKLHFNSSTSLRLRSSLYVCAICVVAALAFLMGKSIKPPREQPNMRTAAFKDVYRIMAFSTPSEKSAKVRSLGWRAAVAAEMCWISMGDLPNTETESLEEIQKSRFEQCGHQALCRPIDHSALMLAIEGPGTALAHDFKSLTELPGNLILFMESNARDIHWLSDSDFELHDLESGNGLRPSSEFGSGFHVAFADGQVWYISNEVPMRSLALLATVESAKKHDRSAVLGKYIIFTVMTKEY